MSDSSLMFVSRPETGIRTGAEIARGGEGAIYELPGRPGAVAKLYNVPVSMERAAKLRAMVSIAADKIPPNTAWPSDLVIGSAGAVSGFVMPRISGRSDLSTLLAGASRRTIFPDADYRMLVASAANLARAVGAVHAAGHVIGDINERCAMVGPDATIRLIDCDSYQIEAGSELYTCDVGTPMYQPPEMLGVETFRGQRRTRDYDAFGLAVLIFQLLFFGRHPFAGRPLTGEAPELPDAIRRFQFAWDGSSGLDRPPATLRLNDVGLKLANQFRRSFGMDGAGQGRPDARSWAALLDRFQAELVCCGMNFNHWHLPSGPCPICEIEAVSNLGFFVGGMNPSVNLKNPELEADELWAAIETETPPPLRMAAPLPGAFRAMITAVPYPETDQRTWLGRLFENAGLVVQSNNVERERRKQSLIACRRRYEELAKQWHGHSPRAMFDQRRAKLLHAREKLKTLFRQRQQAIVAAQQCLQVQQYLANHAITQSGLKGFGRSLTSTLIAHGIGSAADISAANLDAVPGIGPKRKAALAAWQADLVRGYRPSGTAPGLDEKTVQQIDSGLHPKIARLLMTLRNGPASLRALAERERETSSVDMKALAAAALAVAQADADLNA